MVTRPNGSPQSDPPVRHLPRGRSSLTESTLELCFAGDGMMRKPALKGPETEGLCVIPYPVPSGPMARVMDERIRQSVDSGSREIRLPCWWRDCLISIPGILRDPYLPI
jgi:hypothetical protein